LKIAWQEHFLSLNHQKEIITKKISVWDNSSLHTLRVIFTLKLVGGSLSLYEYCFIQGKKKETKRCFYSYSLSSAPFVAMPSGTTAE